MVVLRESQVPEVRAFAAFMQEAGSPEDKLEAPPITTTTATTIHHGGPHDAGGLSLTKHLLRAVKRMILAVVMSLPLGP